MKLYSAILMAILAKEEVEVTFPNLNADVNKLMELECYQALEKIKAALNDLNINDEEAFFKISNIMLELETSGWNSTHRNPPASFPPFSTWKMGRSMRSGPRRVGALQG